MNTKIVASFTMSLAWLAMSQQALSQTAMPTAGQDALYVRTMAASCANCHGTDGKAISGSAVPSLAGMDKSYFIAQMLAFKAGTKPATVMTQLAKGFSNAQIEVLATYFAAQKK
jgi:sulfide dehydrogenase cytochrome subunit